MRSDRLRKDPDGHTAEDSKPKPDQRVAEHHRCHAKLAVLFQDGVIVWCWRLPHGNPLPSIGGPSHSLRTSRTAQTSHQNGDRTSAACVCNSALMVTGCQSACRPQAHPAFSRVMDRSVVFRRFIPANASASFSGPCFSLNASHAASNCTLAWSSGAASGLRAGDVNGDVPQPDPRQPLAGKPEATNRLAVFADPVIVWADLSHGEHGVGLQPGDGSD